MCLFFIYPKYTELLNIVTSIIVSLKFFQFRNCENINRMIFDTLTQLKKPRDIQNVNVNYVRVRKKYIIRVDYRFAVNLFAISCAFHRLIVSLNKFLIGCS